MNQTILRLAAFVLLMGASFSAQAQDIIFSPTFLYYTWDETLEGSQDEEITGTYMDFRLGAKVSTNFYLGGIYSTMSRDYGTNERKRTAMGASAGLMSGNLYLIAHYLFQVEYQRSDSDTLKKGSGLQFDFGYFFPIGGSFSIGPQITHRNIKYESRTSGSTTTDLSNTKHTETVPYVAFAFMF